MKNNQKRPVAKQRHMGKRPVLMAVLIGLILVASAPASWARYETVEFDEAFIFFELNNTDGDLGIHAKIDGDAWKRLEIRDHRDRRMLNILVNGRLRKQGLTELFFESAEPTFDELSPEEFFERFPEGEYTIRGRSLEKERLRATVEISHVMPAPAMAYVNDEPAAEDCDAEDLPEFEEGETITISWDPVTTSHPDLGAYGDVDIHNYEVVVEIDDTPWKTSAILSPDTTSFVVPIQLLEMLEFDNEGEAEVKFEVLARATTYNQTAIESCFVITAP